MCLSKILRGVLPLRKPGIFTLFANLRYAFSTAFATSTCGTSIVNTTLLLSIFSIVAFIYTKSSYVISWHNNQ